MQKRIVIDTNIWIKAMIDSEYNITCDDALSSFFQNKECILALDYKSEIEREYRDNIKNNRRFELRMKQLVLHCVNSSEYAPAVYVICKPHETRRSTTTPSFRGIHI